MGSKETAMGPALLQNCDLPPPLKVFAGPGKAIFSSITSPRKDENELQLYTTYGFSNEKLELLKALRLSQTRAREAERKAAILTKEKNAISDALMEESTRLFAYKQWVRLLEAQVSKLQRQEGEDKEDDSEGAGSLTWTLALTFCLGIAGVGFVLFGCRYLF